MRAAASSTAPMSRSVPYPSQMIGSVATAVIASNHRSRRPGARPTSSVGSAATVSGSEGSPDASARRRAVDAMARPKYCGIGHVPYF